MWVTITIYDKMVTLSKKKISQKTVQTQKHQDNWHKVTCRLINYNDNDWSFNLQLFILYTEQHISSTIARVPLQVQRHTGT